GYLDLLQQEYGLGVRRLDIAGAPTDATRKINEWVDVSESGTRAAAATAGGFASPPSVSPQPKRVIIDRPFFFVIQDDATKAVLFAGRYVKPN
ncbi:MAG TPA: serpin family protein, partial [Archangium sp.]